MDVSVIIVNYNTLELTQACIDSVFENTKGIEFEVILVDNASTDGSRAFFSKDYRITYIYNEDNFGFGKANNIGASVAKGKYLFFLNSDTYLCNDALSFFLGYADMYREEKIGFWGAVLVDRYNYPNGSGSDFPTLCNSLATAAHINKKPDYEFGSKNTAYSVEYVLGADMFTPRALFEKLNGFDEDYFMYYEESDLQRRAYKKGYGAVIIPGPHIVHLEGKSTEKVSHKKRMMVEKSHMMHLGKHYTSSAFHLFLVAYIILKLPVFLTRHYSFHENCEYFRMLISSL